MLIIKQLSQCYVNHNEPFQSPPIFVVFLNPQFFGGRFVFHALWRRRHWLACLTSQVGTGLNWHCLAGDFVRTFFTLLAVTVCQSGLTFSVAGDVGLDGSHIPGVASGRLGCGGGSHGDDGCTRPRDCQ